MELTETLRTECIRRLNLPEAIIVTEETPIAEVLKSMQEARRGCVLIEKHGKLHGLVSERDILVKFIGDRMSGDLPVREIMSTELKTLSPDDSVEKAIQVMSRGGYRHVPLVDAEGKILGMIAARNIVDFITEHYPAEVYNLPPRPDQLMGSPEGA